MQKRGKVAFDLKKAASSSIRWNTTPYLSIIFTTGYYVEPCQNSDFVSSATVESMTRHMVNELTIGSFDCPDVKCGFIGEIGCNYPLLGKLFN